MIDGNLGNGVELFLGNKKQIQKRGEMYNDQNISNVNKTVNKNIEREQNS